MRFLLRYLQKNEMCGKIYEIYKCKYILRKVRDILLKAVITVTGKDSVGIIAAVSAECAESDANILDITQTVLSDYFVMIMLVNIDELRMPFGEFADKLDSLGKSRGLDIHTMHEDIFNSMHKI